MLEFALEAELGADESIPSGCADLPSDGTPTEQVVGRYRLRGEIARGGVGIVYRAWQTDLKREVALKMLLPARLETTDALERFRREAELMASLDHPGILPVYDVGDHDGLPYFSMKLAEGGNLAQRIPTLRGQFRECARLLALITRAIGHAHAHGVLHRDLKPSNIVFDAAGQPLVTDFGLARLLAVDSSLTGIDAVIGTPRYVAPEVLTASAQELTGAADVYGLGAILYELLCGRAPFAELSPLQILQQISTRRPRPPRLLDAAIPAALEAICLRCLEKRATDRYPSADALAAALETWLAGTKLAFFSRLRSQKFGLPSRRRHASVAAAMLLVAGLAAASARWFLRDPIPIPDPAVATRTVAVLPFTLQNATPAEREAARQLAAHLHLSPPLQLLPFAATLETATSKDFPRNSGDAGAVLGAFIRVDVVALAGSQRFALRARDVLRAERLYESTFTLPEVDGVARQLAATLAQRRRHPTAEARLSRDALASLLRAERLQDVPADEVNEAAVVALKDAISLAPDSALAHALLAGAYIRPAGDGVWLDLAIVEAARAQRMDPHLGLAQRELGLAYYFKSWLGRAAKAYEQSHALGSLDADYWLGLLDKQRGQFDESYRLYRAYEPFAPKDTWGPAGIAQLLFTVGENDAGERAMRIAMARDPDPVFRKLSEAEIAFYRHDSTHCRELAGSIDPKTYDGYFVASSLVRICAVEQGDFTAALATIDATKRAYATTHESPDANDPALHEAILLARVNENEKVPSLLKKARETPQAAIDSNSEYPAEWLQLAAAQRLGGEIDAAYATLERAFALGLTVNNRNRSDLEFLPFQGDARFAVLRAKSEAYVAAQRKKIAARLPAELREPVMVEPLVGAVKPSQTGTKPHKL
ncbi:MAG: serine/threonine-protein kinase [Dokdonella sp.]